MSLFTVEYVCHYLCGDCLKLAELNLMTRGLIK